MKKYLFLLLLGATFTLNAQEIELNIPVVKQEQNHWCGAAVSQSVLRYLPPNRIYKQCEIMEWVLQETGNNNCCDDPVPENCNDDGINLYGSRSVQSVLSYFGRINSNPYSSNYPPPAEIYTYLSNNRPLIISVWTLNYDFHAVIVRGICINCYGIEDRILYMNPSNDPTFGGNQEVSYLNLISGFNSPYTWLETLIPCSSSREDPCDDGGGTPEDHCKNRRHDPDLGETGIDCGGPDCPACTLCNNCILNEGEDAMDCGGSCTPCKHVGNLAHEITITSTAQLTSEVKAYKKITAGGATTVASGKKVTFTTDKTGSIVLLPGFKAEEGSNFSAQMQDLSEYKRLCGGSICHNHHLSNAIIAPYYGLLDYLKIYNLNYAVNFGCSIYKKDGYAPDPIYNITNYKITRDGDFSLWNCIDGAGDNPKGVIWYRIDYSIDYCNNERFISSHYFYVDYTNFKSLPKDPNSPETPPQLPLNSTSLPSATSTPNFTIIPNPNPGVFQLETNFPLSEIGNLKITNMMGATVYETQKVASNTVQLPSSATGQYFIVMILKDGTVLTRKMVVQRN